MPNSRSKKHKSSSKIILNVGGTRHETYTSTLRNIPDTRLYYLCEHHAGISKAVEFDSSNNEYFFDRHPGVFAHILNYYRTGKLHCPYDICGPLFEDELEFWGIDEQQVETCCWEVYKQHKEKQEKLKYFKLPGFDEILENNVTLSKHGVDHDEDGFSSWWSRLQPNVWKILEEPHSSQMAKMMAIVSFVLFALYIIKFSLSTLERFKGTDSHSSLALYIIHVICLAWFTIDFVLRVIFSPVKLSFFMNICTWIDVISLIPLFVNVSSFGRQNEWQLRLEMLVMLKVVRIFQLFKLSYVMQVLVNTLKASLRELCVLLVIMAFQTAVFSSILYLIEKDEAKTDFGSVPDTMWWAIITMTTVGYGDVSPQTWMGKIIGSACAIFGVLVIALPVSVVASNFSIFYTYAKARLNVPRKTRRVALSHAITSMQTPRGTNASINNASFSSERRNTQKTLNASEMSFNSNHGSLANSYRSHSNSLQSFSYRDPQCTTPGSKSASSLPQHDLSWGSNFHPSESDDKSQRLGTRQFRKAASEQFLSTTSNDKPRSHSPIIDLHKKKDNTIEKSRSTNVIFSQISLNICPKYPLYLRRGAVTPLSMSIKSNSSNSSYGNIFKSGKHLGVSRPIIFLSGNSLSVQNLRSVQNLIPDTPCSCTSMSSQIHVHSADDTTQITPLLSNVNPYIVSTPALNRNSMPKRVKSEQNVCTNGPIIAISSPSDEKINKLGICKVDKCSQTDLTFEPSSFNAVICDPKLKTCPSNGQPHKTNHDNNHIKPDKQFHLVPNPLHEATLPDEVRHLRRSTTL